VLHKITLGDAMKTISLEKYNIELVGCERLLCKNLCDALRLILQRYNQEDAKKNAHE